MKPSLRACALALAALILLPFVAAAQPSGVPRVGWLQSAGTAGAPFYQGFHQGLRELGYVEGRNIDLVIRSANGRFDRLPALARELAAVPVDAMLVAADSGAAAAKAATDTIPIIVVSCDPLDSMVVSIARPGGRMTGLTCISSQLSAKRLQLLKDLVPSVARVAVLYNAADAQKAPEIQQMQTAAERLGLTLATYPTQTVEDLDVAVGRMAAERAQALVILADPFTILHQKKLADLALANRLPAMFGFRGFADAGGLVAYGASLHETFRRAASYVDKVLKGTDAGALPIDQASRFELVLNLKTARALGLTPSPLLLTQADEVIE